MEAGRKRGMEEDISNSKRRAVFPWQLGSHGNSPAKDAITMKKIPTLFFLPMVLSHIAQTSGASSVFCAYQRSHLRRMARGCGLSAAAKLGSRSLVGSSHWVTPPVVIRAEQGCRKWREKPVSVVGPRVLVQGAPCG